MMHRLFKSSAFRLALVYTLLFALFGLALIGFIYWTTIRVIDAQADATIDAEILGLVEQYRARGLPGLVATVRDRTRGLEREGSIYLLEGPNGAVLAGNLHGWPEALPDQQGWIEFAIRPINPSGLGPSSLGPSPLGPTRARARAFELAGNYHLLVGRDLTERRTFQHIILLSLAGALAILLVLGVVGGLLTSRSLLRRLDAINRTSGEILAGSLDRRVPVFERGDEFDRLATNLNAMLDQIERLMTGMRQVGDNLAHDLRSPLTRLRSRLEQMQREAAAPEGQDRAARLAAIDEAMAEVDRLLATFQALLSIAQVEAGSVRRHFTPLDLAALVQDVVELYAPAAEEKGLSLSAHRAAAPAIPGDRHLLAQALANLIDNAIKYTPSGGRVTVGIGTGFRRQNAPAVRHGRQNPPPLAWLEVADSGPGVPEAERHHVLERFVRLEASRNLPGSGLGLSLVAAVAMLHHAELKLEENGPGLRVALEFPGPSAG